MKKVNRSSNLFVFTAILPVLAAWPIVTSSASQVRGPGQIKMPKDPCWFMSLKYESISFDMIEKRQNREMYGYPTEIPIREAIRIFNEETQCKAPYKGFGVGLLMKLTLR